MSHHKLREEKVCQNCFHFVAQRFCPNCGQENIETRQSFFYLFKHFAEDLVHYDSKFWQTIKYLLFYPGKLTNVYLSGKRKSQVAPVKLYIFISFLTFFIPAILPDFTTKNSIEITTNEGSETRNKENLDFLKSGVSMYNLKDIKSTHELDSIQHHLPKDRQLSKFQYWTLKKTLEKKDIYSHMSTHEIKEKLIYSFIHNLPKALFIYMPFFALSLWLFHGKKKWYYFDHGIFTLHYFSFMLLTALMIILVAWINSAFEENIFLKALLAIFSTICFLYTFFYFFRSHSRIYNEKKFISRIKGFSIFVINLFLIILILIFYIIFTLFTLH